MSTGKCMHRWTLLSFCLLAGIVITAAGCSGEQGWRSVNDDIAVMHDIELQTREDMPDTGIESNLTPGTVASRTSLTPVKITNGVMGKMYWGRGVLVNWMNMEPNTEIEEELLPGERLLVVWEGSVEQLIDGEFVTMRYYETTTDWSNTPHRDFVYMEEGTPNALRAGDEGALVLEIYWPVRTDYVELAGYDAPEEVMTASHPLPPVFPPNQVLNFYDVQLTDLSGGTALSRLIGGHGFQVSFLSADPLRESAFHAHPEEQLMLVLRGELTETIMDNETVMRKDDLVYLPSNMVHRGVYSARGADLMDVFWPPRADYTEKMNAQLAKYNEIIPVGTEPELIYDGTEREPALNFTEGPSWIDGKLVFSNMWFAPGFSEGSPERSNTISLALNGDVEVIASGMQTNGTMPLGNGNLAVCDMFGHRVIEMTPNGRVVRTLASEVESGGLIDGPNDLVIDAKGGIYITDPQFIPGLEKTQTSRGVYYRKPDGTVIRVVEAGPDAMPNGILLSPDGKTLYVNRVPTHEWLAAYDVNEDGTVSNMRKFAKFLVPPEQREQEGVVSGADGMTIDTEGNIYVASTMGLQIFSDTGEFIGNVHLPIRPVSCVFGGPDMQTIYCTCPTAIYAVRTAKKGLQYPLD